MFRSIPSSSTPPACRAASYKLQTPCHGWGAFHAAELPRRGGPGRSFPSRLWACRGAEFGRAQAARLRLRPWRRTPLKRASWALGERVATARGQTRALRASAATGRCLVLVADGVRRAYGGQPHFKSAATAAAVASSKGKRPGTGHRGGMGMSTIPTRTRSHEGRCHDLLQRLGQRPTSCSLMLASLRRRLGRADALLLEAPISVIAHDRRGHGRSTQTAHGHDMDHYAMTRRPDRAPRTRTPSTLVTPLAAARSPTILDATAKVGWPRPCSSAPCRRSWSRPQPIRAAFPRKCSMAFRPSSRPTGRSSTASCPPAPFTASTEPARKSPRASSRTGGARA